MLYITLLLISILSCYIQFITCSSEPLVFDSITFNGEITAVYRLNYLNPVVDYFILTECREAFSGKKRDFYHLDRMREFYKVVPKEKIIELRFDQFPSNVTKNGQVSEAWHKEYFLRNIAKEVVLEKAKGKPFVLIVSDGDEMPSREAVKMLKTKYDEIGDEEVLLQLAYFWYSFQWKVQRDNEWSIAYVITDKLWKTDPGVTLEFLRKRSYISKYFLRHAGWHCSLCMTVEDVMNKFNSYSHQETNLPQYNNPNSIREKFDHGKHISGDNGQHASHYNGVHGYPLPCDSCELIPNVTILHIPFPIRENVTTSDNQTVIKITPNPAASHHQPPSFGINPKYSQSGSQHWKHAWDIRQYVPERL